MNHEKLVKKSHMPEAKTIIYKYNHNDMSRYSANLALEMLMSPTRGIRLQGVRVTVDHDGCSEYPPAAYDGTVLDYNINTKEFIIEYDSGCGSERMDVFKLLEVAKEMYRGRVEEYIEAFGVDTDRC
jgi:hypothetical protein